MFDFLRISSIRITISWTTSETEDCDTAEEEDNVQPITLFPITVPTQTKTRIAGKTIHFICSMRDTVHVFKGMKTESRIIKKDLLRTATLSY